MAPFTRTEDEIMTHAPFDVKFGDKTYKIKPLGMVAQRDWRTKMSETVNGLMSGLDGTITGSEAFFQGLRASFLKAPLEIADLFFAYAKDLDRKEIEADEDATEEQLIAAFSRVMVVAFPFAAHLQTMVSTLKIAGMSSPLAGFTNSPS